MVDRKKILLCTSWISTIGNTTQSWVKVVAGIISGIVLLVVCGCGQERNTQVTIAEDSVSVETIAAVEQKEPVSEDRVTIKEEPASENSLITENRTPTLVYTENFVKSLKKGEKLSSFFRDHWTLVYYKYFRGDGVTEGEISYLSNSQIDETISMEVKNNGEGWFEQKAPSSFFIDFSLKEQIKEWDRFEVPPSYEGQNDSVIYVEGAGASDYLKLYYDHNNLIIKMEYQSVDPG